METLGSSVQWSKSENHQVNMYLNFENSVQGLQSRCFFLGPINSSVVALQTAFAKPWPAMECLAAKRRSLRVWPALTAILLPSKIHLFELKIQPEKWDQQSVEPEFSQQYTFGTGSNRTNLSYQRLTNSLIFRQIKDVKVRRKYAIPEMIIKSLNSTKCPSTSFDEIYVVAKFALKIANVGLEGVTWFAVKVELPTPTGLVLLDICYFVK